MTEPTQKLTEHRTMVQTSTTSARMTAILLMIATFVCFSFLDTTAKFLENHKNIPVAQLVWVRFLGQMIPLMIVVPALGVMSLRGLFTTNTLGAQLLRSVLMVTTTIFNFLALQHLQLDQTTTIMFLTPLLVALVAGPVLGEWVGWRRFAAIVVGFIGILVAVRPDAGGLSPAVAYSFAAVAAYVVFILLTRQIANKDSPLVTLHYSMIIGTVFGAPIALQQWVHPEDILTWVLLLSLGLFGGLGHYLFILAHRLAPASILAPFVYSQIFSMTALGYLIFGDVPSLSTVIGCMIVAASGVYLLHRERVTKEGEV